MPDLIMIGLIAAAVSAALFKMGSSRKKGCSGSCGSCLSSGNCGAWENCENSERQKL